MLFGDGKVKEKKTLSSFVYENLKEQIVTGQIEYGGTLPSMRRLSQIYDVGIRTIKTVLRQLSEERLIQTGERRKTVVIYKTPFMNQQHTTAIQMILRQRSSIIAVYETMELLMPDILTFCAQFCSVIELEHYEDAVKWSRRPCGTAGSWRIFSLIFHDVMRSSGNILFNNLYATLELYAQVPFLLEYQCFITTYPPYFKNRDIGWILDCLRNNNRYTLHENFSVYYHSVNLSMKKSLDNLCDKFPEVTDDLKNRFDWSTNWERNLYYKQIAHDLIQKIGTGIYESGSFLSSEAVMAGQYQVSVHTVRKALSYLNELGFCKTINGRGTKVIMPNNYTYGYRFNKNEMLLYLSALQLMIIAIYPAALLVFDFLDEEVQEQLYIRFSRPNDIYLADILDCIIQRMPLYPLKVILRETNKLINWGFYFYFYSNDHKSIDILNLISLKAFFCLKNGDRHGFADRLFESYCHILYSMREFLIKSGFSEAEHMITPKR